MVTYKLKKDAKSTDSERESLKKAKSMPVIYDDDSPEMSSVSFLWRYLIHSNRCFQSLSPLRACLLFDDISQFISIAIVSNFFIIRKFFISCFSNDRRFIHP